MSLAPRSRPRSLRALALALAALAAAACAGADAATGPRPVASLAFTVSADTLMVGTSARLTVVPRDDSGAPIAEAELGWRSSDSTVVQVSASGVASGRRAGAADVTASSGGHVATLRVVVLPVPVASVTFEAPPGAVPVGSSVQLVATPRDSAGAALVDRTVSFRSSASGVAAVSATGLLRAVAPGTATITAESEGRSASVTMTVTAAGAAPPPSPVPAPPLPTSAGDGSYSIRVSWVGAPDPRASTAVDAVIARWRRAITGDLPNVTADIEADGCYDGQLATRETVDDLLVYVRVVKIDGAAGTLARAGPCLVRGARGLPLVGVVELDSADLGRSPETVQAVLTHEFGHVLGIGTLWEYRSLLYGKDSGDPLFLGATAQGAYAALGGGSALVPVEATGGEGTAHGHWRESTFRSELMTGWIGAGANPMSAMTIASLRDLGYVVNVGAADAYALPARGGASGRVEGPAGIKVTDELILPRFVVDDAGRTRRVR